MKIRLINFLLFLCDNFQYILGNISRLLSKIAGTFEDYLLRLKCKERDARPIYKVEVKNRTKYTKEYCGITHCCPLWLHKLWKKFMCKRNIHIFDESLSCNDHFLSCDACDLVVQIKYIDTTYVEN